MLSSAIYKSLMRGLTAAGSMQGMEGGFTSPTCMIDGGEWEAPKAYKDAKARRPASPASCQAQAYATYSVCRPGRVR